MGKLIMMNIRNLGIKPMPTLEAKMEEYMKFLNREATIMEGENIVVGIKGGGYGILVRLPEILPKACKRQKEKYKRNDVIVQVDLLLEIKALHNDQNQLIDTPNECIDYVRNLRMLKRVILLSSIILPPIIDGLSRNQHIKCQILDQSNRYDSLDIHRIHRNDIDLLHDVETNVFEELN
jgi:hypothetical protein